MPDIIKLKSNTIALSTTANSVYNASLVRLFNNSSSITTVNHFTNTSTLVGSLDMNFGDILFLEKDPADTINTVSGTISCVSIAFRS